MLNLILQSGVAGKMNFRHERAVNTLNLQTGFVNKWRGPFYNNNNGSLFHTR